MSEKKNRKPESPLQAEGGFGGLLKGLGHLIDAAAKLAETGEGLKRTGEFDASSLSKIKGLKDLRGVYGINVRTLKDGSPVVQSFGNIKKTSKGPIVEEVREPIVDLFEEAESVQIVAEMPGVDEKDITVTLDGDILTIHAAGSNREYQKEVLLPSPSDEGKMAWSYRNGILEITIKK